MKKTYSGKFVLRTGPIIHKDLVEQAKKSGLSLNTYCIYIYLMAIGVGMRGTMALVGPQKRAPR